MGLALLVAVWGILPRWGAEMGHRQAALVMEYRDIVALAGEEHLPPESVRERLQQVGLQGVVVEELTGEALTQGVLPLWYGPLGSLPGEAGMKSIDFPSDRGTIWIPGRSAAMAPAVGKYLAAKFPGMTEYVLRSGRIWVLPQGVAELFEAGVLPDVEGLAFAKEQQLPTIYRPAPAPGVPSDRVGALVDAVLEDHRHVVCLAPSGAVVAGYPDLGALSKVLKARGVDLAQVEFSLQIGAASLESQAFPRLLPLHSVTQDEVVTKRLWRPLLVDRMIRAVQERSVRLVLMRPYLLESGSRLAKMEQDLGAVATGLRGAGYVLAWPSPYTLWDRGFAGALACALVALFGGLHALWRFRGAQERELRPMGFGVLALGAVLVAVLALYVPTVARFLGAAVAIFTVTEASLEALEGWRTPLQALSKAVLVLLAGGLAIAAFFGVPEYMLRLRTFSGVKATLLVPPLLVLLHDLRRRVHPESLGRVLSRPPLWGELVLLGGFFLGMVVLAVRSDNVSLAPQWEMALRNSLEQILVARPRNKEVFLGYPALVLWFFVRRMDLAPRYREVLRLCAVFAFASALNSFCHFHTPLYFTLWRVVNGLLGGLLAGLILAVIFRWIVLPLWRRLVPALTA